MKISVTVNGQTHESDVEPRTLLVQYVREDLGLTGTNIGCDTSSCGACSLHLDGEAVKSCTMLAVQAQGARITTIEGLAQGDTLHAVQAAFSFYGVTKYLMHDGLTFLLESHHAASTRHSVSCY